MTCLASCSQAQLEQAAHSPTVDLDTAPASNGMVNVGRLQESQTKRPAVQTAGPPEFGGPPHLAAARPGDKASGPIEAQQGLSQGHSPSPQAHDRRQDVEGNSDDAEHLPNGAWTNAPIAKDEAGQKALNGEASNSDDSSEKKAADTEATRPPAVAERDRQVYEMSQRAKAAAISTPPKAGLLSQSMAYIMSQVDDLDCSKA